MMLRDLKSPLSITSQMWTFMVACVVLLVIVAYPIYEVHNPPLTDYPNHLARMFILSHTDAPFIRNYWQAVWRPIPNLAEDIVVPFLLHWFSIDIAGKLFVFATMFLLFSGTCLVNYALYRRLSFIPLISVLLLPNMALERGFLNFTFATGLMLWVLAGWIVISRRPAYVRVLYNFIFAPVLFICHLHAFAVYCIAMFITEFVGWEQEKLIYWKKGLIRASISSIGLIPVVIVYLVASPRIIGAHQSWVYQWSEKLFVGDFILPLVNWHWELDTIFTVCLVAAVSILLWKRWLTFPKPITVLLVVLLLVYIALPFKAFTGRNIDWRTLVPLSFLFLAGARPKWAVPLNSVSGVLVVLSIITLATVRYASLSTSWLATDKNYVELQRVLPHLPRGAKLFTHVFGMSLKKAEYTVLFIASYAVIERSAFVPFIFANPSQQPIVVRSDVSRLVNNGTKAPYWGYKNRIDCEFISENFDYALFISGKKLKKSAYCGWTPVYRTQAMTLLKIRQSQ